MAERIVKGVRLKVNDEIEKNPYRVSADSEHIYVEDKTLKEYIEENSVSNEQYQRLGIVLTEERENIDTKLDEETQQYSIYVGIPQEPVTENEKIATGFHDITVGEKNKNLGNSSIIVGTQNITNDSSSHNLAIGLENNIKQDGIYNILVGNKNIAGKQPIGNLLIGSENKLTSSNSQKKNNILIGVNNIVEVGSFNQLHGVNNSVKGEYNNIIGSNNKIQESSNYNTIIGEDNRITIGQSNYNFIQGRDNISSSGNTAYSFILGEGNTNNYQKCFIVGEDNTTTADGQILIGSTITPSTDTKLQIQEGSTTYLKIKNNGDIEDLHYSVKQYSFRPTYGNSQTVGEKYTCYATFAAGLVTIRGTLFYNQSIAGTDNTIEFNFSLPKIAPKINYEKELQQTRSDVFNDYVIKLNPNSNSQKITISRYNQHQGIQWDIPFSFTYAI